MKLGSFQKYGLLVIAVFSFAISSKVALAHGDVAPQPVDTKGLEDLGDEWLERTPYVGNELAIKIGDSDLSPEIRSMRPIRFPVNLTTWRFHNEETTHRRTNHQSDQTK